MATEQTGAGIREVLGVLRRRAPWIVLCSVIAAVAAYGFSKHETRQYTATAALSFSNNPLSQQIAGLSGASNTNTLIQQADAVELVRRGDLAAKTANLLGHGLTAERVADDTSVSAEGESNVVGVSATAASPSLAADMANTYVRQFVEEQHATNHEFLTSALALVDKQLARMSPAQRLGQDGLALQDRAQTLRLLSGLDYSTVQVAGEALPPASPSSPKTAKDALIGGALGLLFGLGVAFVLEHLDRRIRRPEELEAIYRAPLLGVVPESVALSGRKGRIARAVEAEAFSLIRAHLRFFNDGDRDCRTIVIASAEPGDGKTTVARHLAEAATRLGSHVLLVEADLRHPTLAHQFSLGPGPGLADVLLDSVSIEEATRSVDVGLIPGDGARRLALDVLTAGAALPPNPGELLERPLGAVLQHGKSAYDLVLIDTPPLAAVSDAFPLLTKVDGVVIVGRSGRSRRDAAERLHQVLVSCGVSVLGVIANGFKLDRQARYATEPQVTATGSAGGDGRSLGPKSANPQREDQELAPTATTA